MSDVFHIPIGDEDGIRADLAINLIAASTGVPARKMKAQPRLTGPEVRARWLAVYLAYVTFGWPLHRVAYAFGLTRTAAANACRWVEDARDAPALDAMLDGLEACARQVLALPRCETPA